MQLSSNDSMNRITFTIKCLDAYGRKRRNDPHLCRVGRVGEPVLEVGAVRPEFGSPLRPLPRREGGGLAAPVGMKAPNGFTSVRHKWNGPITNTAGVKSIVSSDPLSHKAG